MLLICPLLIPMFNLWHYCYTVNIKFLAVVILLFIIYPCGVGAQYDSYTVTFLIYCAFPSDFLIIPDLSTSTLPLTTPLRATGYNDNLIVMVTYSFVQNYVFSNTSPCLGDQLCICAYYMPSCMMSDDFTERLMHILHTAHNFLIGGHLSTS
jgi:hypothetical protein